MILRENDTRRDHHGISKGGIKVNIITLIWINATTTTAIITTINLKHTHQGSIPADGRNKRTDLQAMLPF